MKRIKLAALLVALAALAFSCGGGSKSGAASAKKSFEGKKLRIFNWSMYMPADVIKDFEAETGSEIIYDEFTSNEEMYQKVKDGKSGYDILFPGADFASIMKTNKLLEKLNPAKIPNVVKNVDPAVSAKKKFDPKNEYAVPYFLAAAGITVNKEKAGAFRRSWSIFERSDFKGKLTLLDDPREVIGAALVVNGFSPNSTSADEIAKAEATIMKWKVNIKQFDSGTFQEGFLAGSLFAVHTYAENVWTALDEKQEKNEAYADSYEFFIPEEGNVSYMDTMVIMKDAPSKDLAYAFIDFVYRPEIYARIADNFRIPCVNVPARALVKRPPNYKSSDVERCILKEDVGESLRLYEDAWTRIKTGL